MWVSMVTLMILDLPIQVRKFSLDTFQPVGLCFDVSNNITHKINGWGRDKERKKLEINCNLELEGHEHVHSLYNS